jgi:hypothetical protein
MPRGSPVGDTTAGSHTGAYRGKVNERLTPLQGNIPASAAICLAISFKGHTGQAASMSGKLLPRRRVIGSVGNHR